LAKIRKIGEKIEVEVKRVDRYGRIVLPKKWREREVLVLGYPDHLKILPKEKVDLTKFFDAAEADVAEFGDYHRLKAEVGRKKLSRS